MPPTIVTCPVCRRPTRWEDPPRGPFCSERCRLIDLGAWAEGRYVIPGPPVSEQGTPPVGEAETEPPPAPPRTGERERGGGA
ncbi:MAG TPA: DNA gyrase inhibitor YacG [Thermodesulfobacteriota bacterium]|nr:DNA gyrase inhibitor YacG [Thermodesulfobacteriota bacterium]